MKKLTSRSLGLVAVLSLSCFPLSAEDVKARRVTPPPAGAESAEGTAVAEPEVKQVRKLISSQPDPSLVLELEEEDTTAPKKLTTKAPPKRPVASTSTAGGTKAPASLSANGKPVLKLGGRLQTEIQSGPEVAIILVGKQFFPSRIRLKDGLPTRLYLTTTNDRPAAVVVEQMQIQRWIAKEGGQKKEAQSELERAKFEVRREVAAQRVTEIVLEPMRGTYSFHDVISGAKGQITVE